jgi:hypothetical protein
VSRLVSGMGYVDVRVGLWIKVRCGFRWHVDVAHGNRRVVSGVWLSSYSTYVSFWLRFCFAFT